MSAREAGRLRDKGANAENGKAKARWNPLRRRAHPARPTRTFHRRPMPSQYATPEGRKKVQLRMHLNHIYKFIHNISNTTRTYTRAKL